MKSLMITVMLLAALLFVAGCEYLVDDSTPPPIGPKAAAPASAPGATPTVTALPR